MRLLYFLAIAAVVAAIWFRFRRQVKTPTSTTAKPAKVQWDPEPSYSAVSIKPGPEACDAARAITEKHFSPQEAPRLPLEGCDQGHCDCTYGRESERREAGRRRADDVLQDIIPPDDERRDDDRRDL